MATMPKAPGLFSVTNGCPSMLRSCSPSTRETMSVAPPGAYGTMIRTGLLGYLSWALAGPAASARQNVDRSSDRNILMLSFLRCCHGVVVSHARGAGALGRYSSGLHPVQAVRGVLDR